ncbi:MAG: hypothetical protein OFPI_08890 [Osedax symbiont Rs2]|nr:MAG: hypothetical protein OFPI_08890 [Osedax symbiont Rs2]
MPDMWHILTSEHQLCNAESILSMLCFAFNSPASFQSPRKGSIFLSAPLMLG